MPCTLQPWEVEWEEKKANKESFRLELNDERLMEEVACSACRTLVKEKRMDKAPELVQKWWRLHEKKDKKEGRKVPSKKK